MLAEFAGTLLVVSHDRVFPRQRGHEHAGGRAGRVARVCGRVLRLASAASRRRWLRPRLRVRAKAANRLAASAAGCCGGETAEARTKTSATRSCPATSRRSRPRRRRSTDQMAQSTFPARPAPPTWRPLQAQPCRDRSGTRGGVRALVGAGGAGRGGECREAKRASLPPQSRSKATSLGQRRCQSRDECTTSGRDVVRAGFHSIRRGSPTRVRGNRGGDDVSLPCGACAADATPRDTVPSVRFLPDTVLQASIFRRSRRHGRRMAGGSLPKAWAASGSWMPGTEGSRYHRCSKGSRLRMVAR